MPRSKHLKDADRFSRLIQARHPCVHICTFEEEYALELIRSAALDLRLTLRMWTAVEGVRDGLIEDKQPIPGTQAPAAAMFHLTNHLDRCMTVMVDLGDHLQESTALRALRQLIQHYRKTGSILVLLDHRQTLPPVVASHAFPFDLSLPDETELSELVRQTLRREHAVSPIKVNLRKEQFRAIVKNLRGLTRRQAVQIIRECLVDRSFDGQDVNHVVAAKRSVLCSGGLLEYVESPVTLDGVGGLARLKSWLLKRRHALSEEATRAGLTPPRGLLILGVQGAGKSLCAKAIAAAWQWPLLRLDPGVLYDRYIGESERRLRDALQQAAMMAPIVLWIDEIEKAFASAASHSIDGGLSQRMFGSLLTWMQER